MLHTHIILHGNTAQLPSIRPGDPPASLTDHVATGPVLLVLACRDDDEGAFLGISRAGIHLEQGAARLITSFDYVVERALGPGEVYERPIQTKFGQATLRLTHEQGGA